jgi:hypothetical protein
MAETPKQSSAQRPGQCRHQIRGRQKSVHVGGIIARHQSILCGLKVQVESQNTSVGTLSTECDYQQDEWNCPVFKVGAPTLSND